MVLGLTWEACSILDGHLGARYLTFVLIEHNL